MKSIYRVGILSLFILSLTGFTASAQIVNLLYHFTLDSTQGKGPVSSLIADQQGAFYGTTYEGGANDYGTVFQLTPPASSGAAWKETVLYSFCSQSDCADGSYPTSGLILGKDGALYGTTQYGGDVCGHSGCG